MKFSILLLPFALSFSCLVHGVTLSYDVAYDKADTSLSTVACSDGTNGLLTRGYKTFGSLPKYPNIGGAAAVKGWNSPNCATCYLLTYANGKSGNRSITVLAIDHADDGFNVALKAMDELTNGQGTSLGRVNVTAEEVNASNCGL